MANSGVRQKSDSQIAYTKKEYSVDDILIPGGELLDLIQPEQNGKARIKSVVKDGQAMKKFQAMLSAQGVDSQFAHKLCSSADPLSKLPQSEHKTELKCATKGEIIYKYILLVREANSCMYELVRINLRMDGRPVSPRDISAFPPTIMMFSIAVQM